MRNRAIGHHQRFPQFDGIDPQALGIALRDADSSDERLTALAQGGDFQVSIMQGVGLGTALRFTRREFATLCLFLCCRGNVHIQAVLFESLAVKSGLFCYRQDM